MAQKSLTTAHLPPHALGHAEPFGSFSHANPAAPETFHRPTGERVVVWAGWLDDAADPAQGLFPRDLRTWTEPGWTALRAGLEELVPTAVEAGGSICIRPAAGCVLGDPQACLTFFREHSKPGLELLVDLTAMLTPEMLPELADHAARTFESLGTLDAAVGSVLAVPTIEEGRVRLAALSDHRVSAEIIISAWQASPMASRPVLVSDPRDAALLA